MSVTIEVKKIVKEHINTENMEQDNPEQRLLKIRAEEHKQTMGERRQRQIIGWIVGIIVIFLPLFLLKLLWEFIGNLPSSDESGMWTFITVMFSSTYIAVVALYGGLIAAVFRRIGSDKTDNGKYFDILERIESTLDNPTKNDKS